MYVCDDSIILADVLLVDARGEECHAQDLGGMIVLLCVHPVSITRFPLRRFSPGAGLLRNPCVYR